MNAVKRSPAAAFTVSGSEGNPDAKLFVSYAYPNGSTVKVIDRQVLDGAYAKSGEAIQSTLDRIRSGKPLGNPPGVTGKR